MATAYVKPLYYDETYNTHATVRDGQELDPGLLPVSAESTNFLSVQGDGLAVIAEDMVSGDDDSLLTVTDGKLKIASGDVAAVAEGAVTVPTPADFLSAEEDNLLELGTDEKLYVSKTDLTCAVEELFPKPADLVSAESDNVLDTGADEKLYLSKDVLSALVEEQVPKVADLISAEEDNLLELGTDEKLYVSKEDVTCLLDSLVPSAVSADDGNLLKYGSDKGAYLDAGDLLSDADVNLITTGSDGKILLTTASLKDALNTLIETGLSVSSDAGNMLVLGSDGGLYVPTDLGSM